MTLYCATTNPGKLREFRLAAERWSGQTITVETVPGLKEIEPPEETGATFAENAALKAVYYSRFAPGPVFADDSGLAVDALGGAPGVYSARYAGRATHDAANDADNNALVLERMQGVANRRARFVCVIALAAQGELVETFEGVVEGQLLDAPRGAGGFGYDPLFFYPPFGCTLAEASAEQKLSVSHRGLALSALFHSRFARGHSAGPSSPPSR
ncbi:MAG: RdgB/HAM1 family non-canonical purine NTP pyrophosphatase [Acidobacteria bacterium]|nr:RdgB/HAM1 family non-canonical purine NTP pyrophosphatase [Acidobacteriota bacterium]